MYLTEHQAPAESNYPHVEIKSGSKFINQETVDRLRKEYIDCESPDEERLQEEMLKEYLAGRLSPYEMGKLMYADRGTGKSSFVFACDELQHDK